MTRSAPPQPVLIAGGGIGGMSLALRIHQIACRAKGIAAIEPVEID